MKYTKPFYVRDKETKDILKKGTRSECISFQKGNGSMEIVKNPRFFRKSRKEKK